MFLFAAQSHADRLSGRRATLLWRHGNGNAIDLIFSHKVFGHAVNIGIGIIEGACRTAGDFRLNKSVGRSPHRFIGLVDLHAGDASGAAKGTDSKPRNIGSNSADHGIGAL